MKLFFRDESQTDPQATSEKKKKKTIAPSVSCEIHPAKLLVHVFNVIRRDTKINYFLSAHVRAHMYCCAFQLA